MRVTDFSFELPESLIAHYPMPERSSCRLLSLDGPTGALTHGTFTDLLDKLNPGDLLVFNNTRVIPARLFGRKASGGKIEVLVERMLDDKRILAHIRASKAPKPGAELLLGDDESIKATMTARHDALFGQTEFGNAVDQYASHLVQGFEYLDSVTHFRKVAGAGQSRRAAADDNVVVFFHCISSHFYRFNLKDIQTILLIFYKFNFPVYTKKDWNLFQSCLIVTFSVA